MANRNDKRTQGAFEVRGDPDTPDKVSRYAKIIEAVFQRYWKKGKTEFTFERGELEQVCEKLQIQVPKNLGDVIYTFRYRKDLPKSIIATQPANRGWLILGDGDARYRFRLNKLTHIRPTNGLLVRKIPDATPEIITRYALTDEQALLAKVRYNRLIDIFLGSQPLPFRITCARKSPITGKSRSTNSMSDSIAEGRNTSCLFKRRAVQTCSVRSRLSRI